jgi:hypothetical protein
MRRARCRLAGVAALGLAGSTAQAAQGPVPGLDPSALPVLT